MAKITLKQKDLPDEQAQAKYVIEDGSRISSFEITNWVELVEYSNSSLEEQLEILKGK